MKRSPLFSIFLIVLVDIMGFTIILPLLPFYAEHFGASPVQVGQIIAVYALCQLIAGPILGQLSDRIGRRPVLLVSQAGTFFGFLLLARAGSLPIIFLARIIDGVTAGNLSVAQAYIADVTEPEHRAKSFALIGIAFGLGFLLGPAITSFFSHFDHQYPIYAAAFLSALSIAGTYFLLAEPPKHAGLPAEVKAGFDWKVYGNAFKNPALAPLLWQFLAFIFTFAFFMSGFPLFAERRFFLHGAPFGAKEVGYIYAYVGFLGIIIQGGFTGRLVKFWGEARLIEFGFAGMFLGFLMLGWAGTLPLLLVSVTLAFMGSSILRPSLISLITQHAGPGRQGTAIGITQSLMSVSQIIAPLVGGVMIQHRLLTPWAWVACITSGIGFLFLKGDRKIPIQ